MDKSTDSKAMIREIPLLSPLLDLIFKMLFGMAGCEKSLISLLTAVLRPPVPIDCVTILNPHIAKNIVEEKGIVVDILVRMADGTHVDVEMQAGREPHLAQRYSYYLL